MRRSVVSILSIVALVLGACGTSPSPSSQPSGGASAGPSASAAGAPTPPPVDYDQLLYTVDYRPGQGWPGGSAVIGEWMSPDQLNPYLYSGSQVNNEILAATTRALLNVSPDGRYVTDLAASPITYKDSVALDPSGLGFTVHANLKPNLRWSDGEPLTMRDWEFTWRWVTAADQTDVLTLGWDQIDRVTVSADGLSADFHFPKRFAGWLATIGRNPPLPEHYVSRFTVKDVTQLYPLSPALAGVPVSGPFKYAAVSNTSIELTRNDQWVAVHGHAAYLDRLTFQLYPDPDAEIAAFKAGGVDAALGFQMAEYDRIKGVDPSVGKAEILPAWRYDHLDMNQAGLGQGKGHPALKDVTVRTAIAMSIDKKALYQEAFPGYPIPAEDPCVNALPSNYWQLPNATCPKFDVAAANKLLDAAGYTRGADGIRSMPGDPNKRLELEHCTYRQGFHEAGGRFLERALEAIGIRLNLNYVQPMVLFGAWSDVPADTKCNLAHGNYDTAEFLYQLGFDLFGNYAMYTSDQIPTDANKEGTNYLRLDDPEMEGALGLLEHAIDPTEAVRAAYRMQRAYTTLIPEIPLWYDADVRGVTLRLQGFFPNPSPATDIWNVEDWWAAPAP